MRAQGWSLVCPLEDILPESGVCALLDGRQIAVFRIRDEIFALDNRDPASSANVLSRGIVGDKAGIPKISSPMYKQSFDLRTGQCLDAADVRIPVYPIRTRCGRIEIADVSK